MKQNENGNLKGRALLFAFDNNIFADNRKKLLVYINSTLAMLNWEYNKSINQLWGLIKEHMRVFTRVGVL